MTLNACMVTTPVSVFCNNNVMTYGGNINEIEFVLRANRRNLNDTTL